MTDDKKQTDEIAESLLELIPLLKQDLLQPRYGQEQEHLSKHHFPILMVLKRLGSQSMSELGRRLYISKPHMTVLADKLIEEGLAERMPSDTDRRRIDIVLTPKGSEVVEETLGFIREHILQRLSTLSGEDKVNFRDALITITDILTRINTANGPY